MNDLTLRTHHADPTTETALKVLSTYVSYSEFQKIKADIVAGLTTIKVDSGFVLLTTEEKDRNQLEFNFKRPGDLPQLDG